MMVTMKDLHKGPDQREPELRLSGTVFCEPEDHTTPAFRLTPSATDPMRFHGRPERLTPACYATGLREGTGIGEWTTRPTNLPSGR